MEPTSTSSVAGLALVKYLGSQLIFGAFATALAFIVMPPKSTRELFGRMVCTLLSSFIFGPILVAAAHSWYPGLFESAIAVAQLNGQDKEFGIMYIAAPLQVLAGMPAWWVVGAFMRWFEKRKDADIGSLIDEIRDKVRK